MRGAKRGGQHERRGGAREKWSVGEAESADGELHTFFLLPARGASHMSALSEARSVAGVWCGESPNLHMRSWPCDRPWPRTATRKWPRVGPREGSRRSTVELMYSNVVGTPDSTPLRLRDTFRSSELLLVRLHRLRGGEAHSTWVVTCAAADLA